MFAIGQKVRVNTLQAYEMTGSTGRDYMNGRVTGIAPNGRLVFVSTPGRVWMIKPTEIS